MKILPAVVLFLIYFFTGQSCLAQEDTINNLPVRDTVMQDTVIARDPQFKVSAMPVPAYEMQDTVILRNPRFIVREAPIPTYEMQDTVVGKDPLFVVQDEYAINDSLAQAKRTAALGYRHPLAVSLGNALMAAAEMQDTTIAREPDFVVRNAYARKDSLDVLQDLRKVEIAAAAIMQDTMVILDPAFIVMDVYAVQDSMEAARDSVRAMLIQTASMQDTVIFTDPAFTVREVYATADSLETVRELLIRPTLMQDTVITKDPAFVIMDLYTIKDSLDYVRDSLKIIRDSLTVIADSIYTDSVNRHWAKWKKYQIDPDHSYTLNTKSVLKGKTRSELQYNIADFYLYLNGEPVRPAESDLNFFAAGCLGFKYDDTLLLNSGLGFKVGVGVGIKIFQERVTSSLHANKHNIPVYKESTEDSVYLTSFISEPVTQSLILQYAPANSSNKIIVGEYQATYNKFYEKNEDDRDEVRRYSVRIIFRCRVSGGIESIK